MQNKLYEVALTFVEGIGDINTKQLVSYLGNAEAVLKCPVAKLIKIPGIHDKTAQRIVNNKEALLKAEYQLKAAEKHNTQILYYKDEAYPNTLKSVYDAPTILYYKGNANLNQHKQIGIVGTRNASEYGKRVTHDLIEELSKHQALIVSGLAYGIDIASHKAALKHNVPTVGVMATGMETIYPAAHKKTAEEMLEKGGVLTEQPFETKLMPAFFPQRNRVIAGMSDAVIVVEAAAKGGALITAEFANNYHKEVFAVPGNLGVNTSEGCNLLIRNNKAQIYTSVVDIVEQLNWDQDPTTTKAQKLEPWLGLKLTDDESAIIALLKDKGPIHIDELAWISQMHMNKLASILLNLEFQGVVNSLAGKRYGV